jgi:hypothetical protein
MESQASWFEAFLGKPIDQAQIDQMRALLAKARAMKAA